MTEEQEKNLLVLQLRQMQDLMISTAGYMHKHYADLGHHLELKCAAEITQTWIDNLEDLTTQK